MSRLLIPDAGPLFSLAAGDLLHLLLKFRLGLTDVVCAETVHRGLAANASIEARNLLAFYNTHAEHIETFTTQVGASLARLRAQEPNYQTPPNLGELSIQSLLIDLQLQAPAARPLVLFEDAWFLRNAAALPKTCVLLSTQAFLEYAAEKAWIASAAQARQQIALARPTAWTESVQIAPAGPRPPR
ncbi:MAG: hypothetical protein AB7V41_07515 [Burkholderiaceae bacterium]|jgi:hypothetical protein|nr:hypothetical protein [Burkholderiaceae bacterium]